MSQKVIQRCIPRSSFFFTHENNNYSTRLARLPRLPWLRTSFSVFEPSSVLPTGFIAVSVSTAPSAEQITGTVPSPVSTGTFPDGVGILCTVTDKRMMKKHLFHWSTAVFTTATSSNTKWRAAVALNRLRWKRVPRPSSAHFSV